MLTCIYLSLALKLHYSILLFLKHDNGAEQRLIMITASIARVKEEEGCKQSLQLAENFIKELQSRVKHRKVSIVHIKQVNFRENI